MSRATIEETAVENTVSIIPEVECTLIQADQVVRFDWEKRKMSVKDMLTGKIATFNCSGVQAAAIIAIALGNEEFDDAITDQLYKIAEPVVQDLLKKRARFPDV